MFLPSCQARFEPVYIQIDIYKQKSTNFYMHIYLEQFYPPTQTMAAPVLNPIEPCRNLSKHAIPLRKYQNPHLNPKTLNPTINAPSMSRSVQAYLRSCGDPHRRASCFLEAVLQGYSERFWKGLLRVIKRMKGFCGDFWIQGARVGRTAWSLGSSSGLDFQFRV